MITESVHGFDSRDFSVWHEWKILNCDREMPVAVTPLDELICAHVKRSCRSNIAMPPIFADYKPKPSTAIAQMLKQILCNKKGKISSSHLNKGRATNTRDTEFELGLM